MVESVEDPGIDRLSLVPGSTTHTYLREITVITEHSAYHLSKILNIRKAMGNWK